MEGPMDKQDNLKWCSYGKHKTDRELFGKNRARSDGLDTRCRPCNRQRAEDNREEVNARAKVNARKRRQKLIDDLGGGCACCGDSTYEFLQIDHIDGTGGEHRSNKGWKTLSVSDLRKHFDELQVLCGSCHNSKSQYGACVHQSFRLIDML